MTSPFFLLWLMLFLSYLKNVLPHMFSSKSFIVLSCSFRFLVIYFELTFQYDIKYDQGLYFYIECTVVPAPFVKKTMLSPLICFVTLIKHQLTYMY